MTRPAASPRPDLLGKLRLLRPRFVYVRVDVQVLPVPVLLFAPLSLLELVPLVAEWVIRKRERPLAEAKQVLEALRALRGQTWALRRMPPFKLVEVEAKGRLVSEKGGAGDVRVKIGIW